MLNTNLTPSHRRAKSTSSATNPSRRWAVNVRRRSGCGWWGGLVVSARSSSTATSVEARPDVSKGRGPSPVARTAHSCGDGIWMRRRAVRPVRHWNFSYEGRSSAACCDPGQNQEREGSERVSTIGQSLHFVKHYKEAQHMTDRAHVVVEPIIRALAPASCACGISLAVMGKSCLWQCFLSSGLRRISKERSIVRTDRGDLLRTRPWLQPIPRGWKQCPSLPKV